MSINKLINRFFFFDTHEDAMKFVRENKWRKYTLSQNEDGTWILFHDLKR